VNRHWWRGRKTYTSGSTRTFNESGNWAFAHHMVEAFHELGMHLHSVIVADASLCLRLYRWAPRPRQIAIPCGLRRIHCEAVVLHELREVG
jgi:hypothetical protein